MRATKSENCDENVEELRLKYDHHEAMANKGIIALVLIGGLVCMAAGISGGKEVILSVIGFSAGYHARKGFNSHRLKSFDEPSGEE